MGIVTGIHSPTEVPGTIGPADVVLAPGGGTRTQPRTAARTPKRSPDSKVASMTVASGGGDLGPPKKPGDDDDDDDKDKKDIDSHRLSSPKTSKDKKQKKT